MLTRERKMDGEVLKRLALPSVHWKARLASIPDECRHKPVVEEWCANVGDRLLKTCGLLLFGAPSTGKSACAAICLKAAAKAGVIGYWVAAVDLGFASVREDQFDVDYTVEQRARYVPLLVIDNLRDVGERSAHADRVVDDVVRSRIDGGKTTIITTLLTPEQLKTRFPSFAAALMEAVVPVACAGWDFRKMIAQRMAGEL